MKLREITGGRYPVGMFGVGDAAALRALGVNVVIGDTDPAGRAALKAQGIAFFLNVNVFHDSERLAADPSLRPVDAAGSDLPLDSWQKLVCPTHPDYRREKTAAIVARVQALQPEGVSLDYIRYPVYWERVAPDASAAGLREFCFCDRCRALFQSDTGVRIPATVVEPAAQAEWILRTSGAAWRDWKCGVIASMVHEIRDAVLAVRSGTLFHVHAVPWRRDDFGEAIRRVAGQDFRRLAADVDVFGPMAYHHIASQPVAWINGVVRDLVDLTGRPVWPCVQVREAYDKPRLDLAEAEAAIREGMRPPSGGVVIFWWNELRDDPERQALLRRLAGEGVVD